ncbi:36.4 kDa proline-rich protein-like [Ananas comosus]|uniref:36.4 kDa proline-rich protein-like n=1 Tax=Ananas comosus TaxID=4615 RepID=A0A6P5FYA1_ANACO|nr:36.4 kDa proline-rich protein-like [Ananas comosus]
MGKLFLALLVFLALFYSVLSCPYCPTPVPPIVLPPPPPPPSTLVPCPPPPPRRGPTCPIDTLKLDACVNILGGLVNIVIGGEGQATDACCPVLEGVADLDAALCLCTCIKANLLNINILLPIAIEVLLDCGKHIPSDYQCPGY